MYKIDAFCETGFNAIDIPASPEMLYDNFDPEYSWEDMNIVQDEWEANVIVDNLSPEEARKIDYVVIYDEDDEEKRTCYTVKNYQMLAPGTIKLNLLLDPYNTMGGFEQGSGNVVLTGSANRLTVPLQSYIEGGQEVYPKREDNTFFTLEEPFQPSNKILMTYGSVVPPTPPPTPQPNGTLKFSTLTAYAITFNEAHYGLGSAYITENGGGIALRNISSTHDLTSYNTEKAAAVAAGAYIYWDSQGNDQKMIRPDVYLGQSSTTYESRFISRSGSLTGYTWDYSQAVSAFTALYNKAVEQNAFGYQVEGTNEVRAVLNQSTVKDKLLAIINKYFMTYMDPSTINHNSAYIVEAPVVEGNLQSIKVEWRNGTTYSSSTLIATETF